MGRKHRGAGACTGPFRGPDRAVPGETEAVPKYSVRVTTEYGPRLPGKTLSMLVTVEELRQSWEVVGRDLRAASDYQAVSMVSSRPGMYRTAAAAEPNRHYFWLPPQGRLEPMDD